MDRSIFKPYLDMVIVLGFVWGFSQGALGRGLRSCAAFVSGSLMIGVALFFRAAGWIVSRGIFAVLLMAFIAILFKIFDALLLPLPLKHGAIGNPIFAFLTEAGAFVIFLAIIKEQMARLSPGQVILGGMTAIMTLNFFLMVRYVTGVPACVFPGTGYPLLLYYIHFAGLAFFLTVPFGFWVGSKMKAFEIRLAVARAKKNSITFSHLLYLFFV